MTYFVGCSREQPQCRSSIGYRLRQKLVTGGNGEQMTFWKVVATHWREMSQHPIWETEIEINLGQVTQCIFFPSP
jgi:hypothetical protein